MDYVYLVSKHGMGPNMALADVRNQTAPGNVPDVPVLLAALDALRDFTAAGFLPEDWRHMNMEEVV